jgi:hypothetical protein
MLVWEDECWFSRFAHPTLKAWSRDGKPLEQKEQSPEAKAVACYGAVEEETGQVLLRFSPGQLGPLQKEWGGAQGSPDGGTTQGAPWHVGGDTLTRLLP